MKFSDPKYHKCGECMHYVLQITIHNMLIVNYVTIKDLVYVQRIIVINNCCFPRSGSISAQTHGWLLLSYNHISSFHQQMHVFKATLKALSFCDHLCTRILLKGIVVFGLEAFYNVHHLLIMCNFLIFVM